MLLRLIALLTCLLASGWVAAQTGPVVASVDSVRSAPRSEPAETIHFFADEMPAFPGGEQSFQQFIREKINYPVAALNKGISGKVHVRFIVDADGRIRDAEVLKGLGYGLDQEALRLVRIMPWWTPGRLNGQPVRVSYTLPVVFRAAK